MIYSLKGTVSEIFANSIILDIHDIFYKIYIAHPAKFNIGQEYKILIFEVYRQDERFFIGFSTTEERDLFKLLLKVKGMGPKSIIKAFNHASIEEIISAIQEENINYLSKIPGFGKKIAPSIIFDLKGKLPKEVIKENDNYSDCKKALLSMGFKNKEIEKTLSSINATGLSTQEIIKMALAELR